MSSWNYQPASTQGKCVNQILITYVPVKFLDEHEVQRAGSLPHGSSALSGSFIPMYLPSKAYGGAHYCLLRFPYCQEQGVVIVLGGSKAVSLHWVLEKDVDSQANPLLLSYSLAAQISFFLRYNSTLYPRLTLNSVCSLGWF